MSPRSWYLVYGIFLHVIWSGAAKVEFYSSVDSMQDLAQVEQELLNATRSYLETQQQQLNFYRRYVDQIKREHEWAVGQLKLDEYLGHPLHAFRLIKRLVQDWDALIFEPILTNQPREDFRQFSDVLTRDLGYPDQSELQGAIKGLARLQRVYNLSTSDLAGGVINGFSYDSELQWPMANFELGNTKRAGRLLNQILKPEPTHTAQQTRKYLENHEPGKKIQEKNPSWYGNYTRLCQGKRLPEESSGSPLKCYLDGKRHAYFTLAPLQVEPVHLDPDISVYHGMLNSQQILSIFEEADKEEMVRSAVAGEGGKRTVRDLRVSQQTWLDYTTPIMESVSRIIQFVSGFDMAGAEHMQVANYGVGGQYEPHPDYFEVNLPSQFEGDRISTSMFYLSDVEQGGYTVFTKLNVFLPPVKGALVMWHNLHRSLDVDVRTLHAGCPVIVGSKRIGNIWMHSGYQEFRRPCNLTSDSYKSAAYRKSV
ncbi:hypothetical protein M5D96_001193 [Drosophila gunungcola]|uniref:procollagen-proline 4-dioxygenase n=1 Tax=Drosophila gunungcola TaxID=103775 RepID=A0A9P9YXQ3_9MUSC|nr:hypothetical protein M5D96_001193 [Drosophila gunungcola]